MKKVSLLIVSDSVGETAQKVIDAVSAQFSDSLEIEIKRYAFVTDSDDLRFVLREALSSKAILVTTLVNSDLVKIVKEFTKRTGLAEVDLMTPLTELITAKTGMSSLEEPGALYKSEEKYISRVPAIEFATKYDDGKDPKGFLFADIIILGVSRSAKTPLSMYLANKGFKVANLPLIPEVEVPKELFEISSEKIFGLVGNPETILDVRKSRLEYLGLNEGATYATLDRIKEELTYAAHIFKQTSAQEILVDKRSIEEISAEIEEIMAKKSN